MLQVSFFYTKTPKKVVLEHNAHKSIAKNTMVKK